MHLSDDSQATLAAIREIIRKSGFTPKDASVHVSGQVVQSNNGQLLLKTDVETFKLNAQDQTILSQLSKVESWVTVEGSVAAGDDQPLSVTAVE